MFPLLDPFPDPWFSSTRRYSPKMAASTVHSNDQGRNSFLEMKWRGMRLTKASHTSALVSVSFIAQLFWRGRILHFLRSLKFSPETPRLTWSSRHVCSAGLLSVHGHAIFMRAPDIKRPKKEPSLAVIVSIRKGSSDAPTTHHYRPRNIYPYPGMAILVLPNGKARSATSQHGSVGN